MDANMIELLKTENLAYKRKLQSKSEALHIIQSQLLSCQQELDQLRRARSQQSHSHPGLEDGLQNSSNTWTSVEVNNRKLMDENKLLQFDIEDLRQKLNDANNDIKVLRKQQAMMRNLNNIPDKTPTTTSCIEHLELLEHLNRKYSQLEQDLQILLDEKQDLIKQRDIYYDKMSRLNIQIKNLLNISNQNIDFDAIVMENKYLKQRLEDVLNEKKLWSKTVSKYKTMLNNNCQSTGKILSYDQIAKHINTMTSSISSSKHQPEQSNLKQICITLLETLNEKNLLLQHQRKTNKLLAHRILDLERKNSEKGESTCDVLLKGYSASGGNGEVDIDMNEKREDVRRTSTDINGSQENKDNNGIVSDVISRNRGESDESIEKDNRIREETEEMNEQMNIYREKLVSKEISQTSETSLKISIMKEDKGEMRNQEGLECYEHIHNKCNEQMKIPQSKLNADNQVIKSKELIDKSASFEEHEDIQSLPIELQKLVLQAMKDLEEDTKGV